MPAKQPGLLTCIPGIAAYSMPNQNIDILWAESSLRQQVAAWWDKCEYCTYGNSDTRCSPFWDTSHAKDFNIYAASSRQSIRNPVTPFGMLLASNSNCVKPVQRLHMKLVSCCLRFYCDLVYLTAVYRQPLYGVQFFVACAASA